MSPDFPARLTSIACLNENTERLRLPGGVK